MKNIDPSFVFVSICQTCNHARHREFAAVSESAKQISIAGYHFFILEEIVNLCTTLQEFIEKCSAIFIGARVAISEDLDRANEQRENHIHSASMIRLSLSALLVTLQAQRLMPSRQEATPEEEIPF